MSRRDRIAIIGTGISGLAAAWLLDQRHDITVYEQGAWVGGHCNTVDVPVVEGATTRHLAVDTGFIVYNERTYPNLTALFAHIDVATIPSQMSFSASVGDGRFEYAGNNLASLIAQKRNLLRPRFWNMVRDILRFYREAVADAARAENAQLSLGAYLARKNYSEAFIRDHLLPMGGAIWSASLADMHDFPLAAFVRFFANHGLLETRESRRPQWRTVVGGSRAYVAKLSASFAQHIRLNCGVRAIRRGGSGVEIVDDKGHAETFDQVVIATHSDQALRLLAEPTAREQALLSQIRYERNVAVLHGDTSLMPKRKRAWAAWNYTTPADSVDSRLVSVTYWMNMLQSLETDGPVFVTLNPHRAPRAGTEHARFDYEHPIFDLKALAAQRELWALQGQNRTWFCGSYCGYGFHEDAFKSGLAVAEKLGASVPWGGVLNVTGKPVVVRPAA